MAKPKKSKKKTSKRWKVNPGMALFDKVVAKHKKIKHSDVRLMMDDPVAAVTTAGAAGFKAGKKLSKKGTESRRGSRD
jgi:hypothetical protein